MTRTGTVAHLFPDCSSLATAGSPQKTYRVCSHCHTAQKQSFFSLAKCVKDEKDREKIQRRLCGDDYVSKVVLSLEKAAGREGAKIAT